MKKWLCMVVIGLVHGCTGTDYINDPPMLVEPRILVNPDMAALEVGTSQSFTATYFDDMGKPVADATIRWSISAQEIATVDQEGTVRGLSEGQVTITASIDGLVSDSVLVNVVDDSDQVAIVRLSPTRAELQPQETLQMVAESSNARGDLLTARTYIWHSSDEAVITIDAAGLATALAPGQAIITASTEGITSNLARLTVPGAERTGMFVAHPGSQYSCQGTAVLRPLDSGGLELVFANDFLVSNGPRLEVFLANTEGVGPTSINIAPLQKNAGAQSYELPDGIELNSFNWVIIHCVPFNVTFGYAQLR